MNKIIASAFILLLSGGMCLAQIGINTENPKTILHIDGASTTATTNPLTGSITPAQAADDVVITTAGRVGIGTITPSTKVEIISSTPGAIKIVDTNQGVGRVLISDTNGVGTWTPIIGTWYAILNSNFPITYQTATSIRQITKFTTAIISNPALGSVNTTAGNIKVPYTGKYRITIAGHWGTNRVGTNPYLIAPYLAVNGSYIWNGSIVGYSNNWGLSPTFVTILNFNANDTITVYNDERSASNSNMVDQCILIIEFIQ